MKALHKKLWKKVLIMTMTIEQEDLLSKLAIAYYKQQKELNILVYLSKRAEEAGDESAVKSLRDDRRVQLGKMEAILELAEDSLITAHQIEKEVMVIQKYEKQMQAIVEDNMAKHEERMKELGLSK